MSWIDDLPTDRHDKIMAALDQRGRKHLRYAAGDRDFAAWLLVADTAAYRYRGVSLFDLADYRWRDAYEDGAGPAETLRDALQAEGW